MRRHASVLLLLLVLQLNSVEAQPNLVGEIKLEEASEAQSGYQVAQDGAIQFFSALGQAARSGQFQEKTLTDGSTSYLTAVYLLCSVNQGVCPLILDGVLEADIVNSRLKNSPQCSQMKTFWKQWIQSDMEERHQYLIKTGFITASDEFKKNKRPRYVKCEETVTSELQKVPSLEALRQRFIVPSGQFNIFEKMAKMLEQVKAKVPDVFASVEAKNPFIKDGGDSKKSSSKKAPPAGAGAKRAK